LPRPNSEDFRKYRAAAPAHVSDEKIHELIARHAKDPDAVNAAVNQLWEGGFSMTLLPMGPRVLTLALYGCTFLCV